MKQCFVEKDLLKILQAVFAHAVLQELGKQEYYV